MSANAGTWFYRQPEAEPYMVTERLNGTFWQARLVLVYWRCTSVASAGSPFRAEGFMGDHQLEIEWVPNQWFKLKAPAGFKADDLVKAISKSILAIKASLSYGDPDGNQYFEWHTDGGKGRWKEIQGTAGFVKPRRLA
jgi:hypothetical protein